MSEHILEIKDVTKRYRGDSATGGFRREKKLSYGPFSFSRRENPGEKVVLAGVNLILDVGDRLALVGASAAGKSTLVKMIFGLERPSSGEIFYRGTNLTYAAKNDVSARILKEARLILQDPRSSFDPKMTVLASVAEPLTAFAGRREGRHREYDKAEEAFKKVGLSRSLQNYYPHQLSGGQLQRAAIARAIVSDPKLIVADEMLSALDPPRQKEILDLFMDMFAEKSLIFIAHDLSAVKYLCNKIAVLSGGKIVEYGSLEEVMANPKDDYTKNLIRADVVFGRQSGVQVRK